MDGKEAIVGKILSDAEDRAKRLTAEAEARAEAMAAEADRAAAGRLAAGRRAAEKRAEEIAFRRETVAALENRKTLLAAKRGIIDEVLEQALALACAFPKERYLAVIERLLEAYAQEGDEVTLSSAAPFGERELTALRAFSANKLRFAGTGSFEGGIRLENATCVKDLSFRALLEADRYGTEQEIAAAVFPAENAHAE